MSNLPEQAAAHRLDHVALFHHGPMALAQQVAPMVRGALDAGDAVLLALDPAAAACVADELGERADSVTWMPRGDRYARPSTAVAELHSFITTALANGAPSVWSIGTLGYDGTDVNDSPWIRYEFAVNDVLDGVPLHAICTHDLDTLPASAVEAARRAHPWEIDDVGRREPSPSYAGAGAASPAQSVERPAGPGDVHMTVTDAAAARYAVRSTLADRMPSRALQDLLLVVTELATNGLRHGAGPVVLNVWLQNGAACVEVTDGGAGIDDPFADLRPPARRDGGYGLWLVSQVSAAMHYERTAAGTRVVAVVPTDA